MAFVHVTWAFVPFTRSHHDEQLEAGKFVPTFGRGSIVHGALACKKPADVFGEKLAEEGIEQNAATASSLQA